MTEDDKQDLVSPDDAVLTADALKAMGHPLRWRILCALGDKEITVGELAKQIGTTQSNMSQHLDQLRNKRILVSRKEANRMYYRVRNEALLELIGSMRSVLCETNLKEY
jgi:DNA-binding transcriptional ArsR family regulator